MSTENCTQVTLDMSKWNRHMHTLRKDHELHPSTSRVQTFYVMSDDPCSTTFNNSQAATQGCIALTPPLSSPFPLPVVYYPLCPSLAGMGTGGRPLGVCGQLSPTNQLQVFFKVKCHLHCSIYVFLKC